MLEKFIENYLMKSRISQQVYIDRVLLAGSIKDMCEYKYVIGKLNGLREADDLIRCLYKAMVDRVDFRENKEISIEDESESY